MPSTRWKRRTRAIINSHWPRPHLHLNPTDMKYGSYGALETRSGAAGGNRAGYSLTPPASPRRCWGFHRRNLFMLNAFQRGQLPVESRLLMRAVELNGVMVGMNKRRPSTGGVWPRMTWTRSRPRHSQPAVRCCVPGRSPIWTTIINHRPRLLTAPIQDQGLCHDRYEALVRDVQKAEQRRVAARHRGFWPSGCPQLLQAAGHKDRYEGGMAAPIPTAPSAVGCRTSSRATTKRSSTWRRR